MVGYRKTGTPPVPEGVRQRYDTSLRTFAASFDRLAEPVTLHLGSEASALFEAERAEIEPRRRPDADVGHIQGWSSKLDGAVVRIAGLLHLAETFTSGWDTAISAPTMAAALEVGNYVIDHAVAAFDLMGADPRLEAARRIGRWIVATHQATFTQREAFRALRGQTMFATVERLAAGLAVLGDHGWVRQLVPAWVAPAVARRAKFAVARSPPAYHRLHRRLPRIHRSARREELLKRGIGRPLNREDGVEKPIGPVAAEHPTDAIIAQPRPDRHLLR